MNNPQKLSKTTRAKAPDFISSKMPFQASALSGVEGTTGPGLMSDDETREYRKYGTPIAWHGDAGWQQSTTKYSSTTSRHQSIVKRALNDHFQSGHDNAKNPDYGLPLGEK